MPRESRDEQAGRRVAEELAREGGLGPEQVAWAGELEARRIRRQRREGRYPEVIVEPKDAAPVFAELRALDQIDGRDVAIYADLAVSPGGTVVVRRLRVEPFNPYDQEFEVTAALLRKVPFSKLRARALRELREVPEVVESANRVGLRILTRQRARAIRRAGAKASLPAKRPGRSGYPDEHYRRIALAYLGLLEKGFGRGILNELAAAESKRLGRKVPRETVRDWVRGARERGFLTEGRQGRAGAQPGPNLYPESNAPQGADRKEDA